MRERAERLCAALAPLPMHPAQFRILEAFRLTGAARLAALADYGADAASSTRAQYVDVPRLLASLRNGPAVSTKLERLRDHALALLVDF